VTLLSSSARQTLEKIRELLARDKSQRRGQPVAKNAAALPGRKGGVIERNNAKKPGALTLNYLAEMPS